jgi:FG-GAP-like repeat/ASPIC and UnbV
MKMHILTNLKLRYLLLTLAIFFLLSSALFYARYPGSTRAIFYQFRYATLDEHRNLYFLISYWLTFMQKFSFDTASGFYNFDNIAQDYDNRPDVNDFEKGKLAYHRGEFAQAITLIEQDIDRNGESESKLFWLANSYLRQAESENCVSKLISSPHNSDKTLGHHSFPYYIQTQLCALPLTQFHDKIELSKNSAKLFERLLDNYDKENRLYRWLLNFSYMTINGFPQDVPSAYLIHSHFTESFYGEEKNKIAVDYAHLSFEDRARDLNVDTYNTGRGVAIEDFDKDGYLDIVTGGGFDVIRYYKNDHGRGFIDRTDEVGLGGIKQPFIITAVDYDNDGWIDVFIGRPFGNYMLVRNNGDGNFTDVTSSSGLLNGKPDGEIAATWVSAWADVNNDGYADLFLAQWGLKLPFVSGIMAKPRMDSKLFLNDQGYFIDKTKEYNLMDIVRDQYFIGAAFGDYDSDGYQDLFLSSPLRNVSVLLKNEDGKQFKKMNLLQRTEGGFVAAFIDINHDGKLDIFQAGFADAKTSTEMAVFGEHLHRYQSGHSTILLQNQDGHFEERNDFFGGNMPMSTMGASYGDIDNDGCYDFYLGTGTPEGWFVLPNLMYIGERDGTKCIGRMKNISMLEGFGTIQKGHGIVFFDFDNDGRQDIYSSLGGMWPADPWPNQFFVNHSQLDTTWVKIRLRGRATNYFGIGARIRVTAVNGDGAKLVRYYHMDNKTGFGSAPYMAHFGLLDATSIEKVEVFWPVTKKERRYSASLGTLNILDENEGVEN